MGVGVGMKGQLRGHVLAVLALVIVEAAWLVSLDYVWGRIGGQGVMVLLMALIGAMVAIFDASPMGEER